MAVCQCEESTCDDFELSREEASLLTIDSEKLAARLIEPLPLLPRVENIGNTSAWCLGEAMLRGTGEKGVLVVSFHINGNAIRNAAIAVSAARLGRTVFVCRTTRPRDIEAMLPESRVVDFDDVWSVKGGVFSPGKSAKRIFAGWGDETSPDLERRSEGARFSFQKRGDVWEVIYEGRASFHIKDTLGARYIDYLLHHPNDPISSFDLEIEITPEKAEARGETTIQNLADPEAVKSYLKTLTSHRAERDEAAADGDEAEVRRLDDEIDALETVIKRAEAGGASDRGERARMNVGKAIAAVRRNLASGTVVQKSFGKHLDDMLSTGYNCTYRSAEGRIWQ